MYVTKLGILIEDSQKIAFDTVKAIYEKCNDDDDKFKRVLMGSSWGFSEDQATQITETVKKLRDYL